MAIGLPKSKSSTLEFIVTFIALFLLTNLALKYFFPEQFGGTPPPEGVVLRMEAESVREGNDAVAYIENNTKTALPLPQRCPQPPVDVAIVETADGTEKISDLMTSDVVTPCETPGSVPPGKSVSISLRPWKYSLFEKLGTYQLSLTLPEGFPGSDKTPELTTRFTTYQPGFFTKLFRTFVTKPLLNALVFVGAWVPGHNLGIAIIVLTIIVKLILLVPNQHALEGQKKLQAVQPRMDEIKKKYPNDPKKVQEETMRLWKEMKINPVSSCLPTLLQFPILIGLFYVIQYSGSIETSRHLLYPMYQDLPWTLAPMFLGFDLLKPSRIIFPPLLVALQFFQMKMMMAKHAKKDDKQALQSGKPSWLPEMNQQTIMTYGLPLMIGVFAFQFPTAVSLYWAVSTVFGIVQQWFVMKKH